MAMPLIKILEDNAALVWKHLQALYPRLNKYPVPEVVANNRLWRTAGLAWCEDHRVEFATKFFGKYRHEMLAVIVPHELAHIADYIMHGAQASIIDGGHGKTWQKIMHSCNLPGDKYHTFIIAKNEPAIKYL